MLICWGEMAAATRLNPLPNQVPDAESEPECASGGDEY